MSGKSKLIKNGRGSRKFSKSLLHCALAAILASGTATSPIAGAADRFWDANGTGVGSGESGTWNQSNLNWSPNGDGVSGPFDLPWNNAALDNAIFGGTAGTVTLGSAITAHDLTFNVGGYVLTGNTLTLGGVSPTITTTSGTTSISSAIAGTSGLVKNGGGTLRLTGANMFSGTIEILGGTLSAGSDGALGAAGNGISTAAGTSVGLRIDGAGTARSVTIGDGGTLTISGAGVGSALIGGNGRVNVAASNDSGIVHLTNDANTYTGATIFNGCNGVCSAYFSSIADLGVASSLGAPTTVANGTVVFNQSSQYSDSVIYIGDGDSSNRNWDINSNGAQIRNRGTGTLTITGDVDISSAGAFSAETASFELLGVLSGGAYAFSAGTGQSVTLGGANTFTGQAGISGLVKASVLADGGSASSLGAGSNISMSAGVLSYTGTGGGSDRNWLINGSSSLLNDGSGALALSGDFTFNTASPVTDTLTLGGSFAGANSISGTISGAGHLVGDGAGTWSLDGANTFTGSVTVNDGTLRAGSASAFGTPTGFTVNGGTLDLNGFDLTAPSIGGTGGTIALGSGILTVNATTAQNYAGSIVGSGGLTKSGAGTLTLTGASTYTGATTINGGRLALDFTGAGGPTDDILSASSPLVLSGGALDVLGAAGESNSQAFAGLTLSAGNNTVRAVSGSGGNTDLSLGTILRTGGLVNFVLPEAGAISTSNADGLLGGWATIGGTDYAKVEGGNIVAFDEDDYTDKDDAATWLSGEVISDASGDPDSPFYGTVGSDVALGGLRYTAAADSTVTIGTGNTLGVDGTIIVAPSVGDGELTLTGGSLTGGAGGSALGVQHNGEGAFVIASQIVDNGGSTSFVKGGAGRVWLTGSNAYTGATIVSDGILQVGSIANGGVASSIGASSAASSNLVLEGGTLRYGGASATTDRGFTLVNGSPSRTIEVASSGTNLTFTGLVTSSDDAGFTKAGSGTLTLANGANDYIGVTTVTGGTLAATTLTDGGVASSIGAASSDPANIVLAGGTLAYTGATTGSDRGITLGSGGGGIGVADAGSTLTLSGILTGTSLRKTGAGTLVLGGANTYTDGTAVNQGTLRAGAENVFGGGAMSVAAGALLDLDDFDNAVRTLNGAGNIDLGSGTLTVNSGGTFTGTISGTGGLTRSGTNQFTLSLNGCNNTYTGVTTITNTTTLATNCLANGGEASGIGASSSASSNLVLSNGYLNYTGGSVTTDRGFTLASSAGVIRVNSATTTLEFTGDIVGGGYLRKDGLGTLVVSGENTSTGGAQITGGTLRAGTTNAIGSGALWINNTAGVLFDLDGHDTQARYLSGGGTTGGAIDLAGATLTISLGNGSSTSESNYAGLITGNGNLVKNGTSLQRLSGCDSDYDGVTTINAGVLEVACLEDGGENSSIGASSAAAANLVLNGGTLRYIGSGGSTNRQFTLGASATSRLESSGTGAIAFTDPSAISFSSANTAQTLTLGGTNTDDNTLAARITNNGTGVTRLTKTDAGTWILSNSASDYTGITTISGGVLGVDKLSDGGVASSIGASSAAAANLVIGNGSTLRYTGDGDSTNRLFTLSSGVTYIESSGTGAVVFTDTGPVTLQGNNQARTIALGGSNTDLNTLAGSIGNAGTGVTTLAKNDSGTWVLTGNHSYTGSTNVNGGILFIGDGGTTGSIVSSTVNNFGTLGFNRSDDIAYGGAIVGTGSLLQAGTGTTTLTGTSTYSGGTTIEAGTLQLGNGGTTGSIVGNVDNDGTFVFNRSNGYTFGGTISGDGRVVQQGTGTTVLTGTNTYAGGTRIDAGTLQISNDANLGAAAGLLTFGGGTLRTTADIASARNVTLAAAGNVLTDAGTTFTLGGTVSGANALTKSGAGTLALTANNAYTGGTTIAGGTLQLGDGGTSGWILGDVANNGTLAFDRSDDVAFSGLVSGTGGIVQNGSGIVRLTADNGYGGTTVLNAGKLLVNGDQSAATGTTTVNSGATLGGNGTIGGDVVVNDGGTLSPGDSPGTLTIAGDLSLSGGAVLDYEFGEANVVGGALNDLVEVGGDLVLDGTINVSVPTGGSFGGGIYRVFNYGGALTDNGLNLGTLPAGAAVTVQTSVAGQVNLVNSTGLELNFWDGNAGPKFNDSVDGGAGIWQLGGTGENWTDQDGAVNAAYANGGFAVFMGAGDNVTVDNGNGDVTASGMQFASDGYVIAGDALTLTEAESVVRVGDGTAAGTAMTATIATEIAGVGVQLVKTDLGTLVLTGGNSYSGGTRISGGTLQLGDGGTGGSILGDVVNDGTLAFDRSDDVAFDGAITGGGGVLKQGDGVLTLTGTNGYAGGTTIEDGTLRISSDANLGAADGTITFDGGTLHTTADIASSRDVALAATGTVLTDAGTTFALDGTVSGTGGLAKAGTGTLVLTGANTYAGGTTIAAGGKLQLGDGGTSGSIEGDVENDGTLAFDRSDDLAFDGIIAGDGTVLKQGGGVLTLAGTNAYLGGTTIEDGTLRISADANLGDAAGVLTFAGGTLHTTADIASSRDATLAAAGTVETDADTTFALDGTVSGASDLVKSGAGTLILSGVNTYAGGTTIEDGTLQISADANLGDAAGALTFAGGTLRTTTDIASSRDATLAAAGTVQTDAGTTFEFGGTISGAGALTKSGAGTLVLTADNDYAGGTTVAEGTLQIGAGGTSGWILGDVANDGTLAFDRSDDVAFAGLVSGSGAVVKQGDNVLVLTADNSYTGGTTIAGGTLQLGDGGTSGWIVGDVANDGTLAFDRSDDATFAGLVSGSGGLVQNGAGTVTLTADNSYGGTTVLNAGTLLVNGDQTAATGATAVNGGATLGGNGVIGGDVAVASGGSLNPGLAGATPGVLTINGNLSLADGATLDYDFGEADVVGGAFNDLVEVGGDLVLDGTLNVATSAGGSFAPGIYRVFNYAGALSDNGLVLGAVPSGTDFYVQTSVAHEVNLVNTSGLALRFWDGAAGGRNDGVITGGDGVWQNTDGNDNWTLEDGSVNAPYLDSAFAIFQGAAGTVTVDDSLGAIRVAGMQFAADGYLVEGDGIELVGSQAVIRVGDGTVSGGESIATIASELTGSSQLVKSDAGTLVLAGANSYTGGTLIDGGTLRIADDASLGAAAGGLAFAGGTLHTTADVVSARGIALAGDGATEVDADTTLTLSGALSGAGALGKLGDGTLVLSGTGSHGGGTTVDAGTLLVNGDYAAATGPTGVSSGATLGGIGTIGGDVTLADGAILAPGANGPGTLTIDGSLSLASGSVLAFEFGQANVVGGDLNDLVNVGGDLVLDGSIDVTVPDGGSFGAGVYRVFNYGGVLTDNGLELGTLPGGSDASVQTSIAGQVNLVNSAGLTLNFWDGAAGPKNDGAVNGGDGVWQNSAGNENWTDSNGDVNAAYTDGAFAIFGGVAGTVEIDNGLGAVSASGLQFATDGYTIVGDDLALVGPEATIRVGDGTAAGEGFTATIDATLTGESRLVKTDAGTLVLNGDNLHAGGTLVGGGTLQIARDANLGAASGQVTLDGGTLATSADLSSSRTIELAGDGVIATATDTTFTFDGLFSGSGALTKTGTGTLLVTGDNDGYLGATTVAAGTLDVLGRLGGAVDVDVAGRLQGTGQVGSLVNAGIVAPGSGGIGTLTVTGDYTGSGGTLEIEAVLGDDSSSADRLVVNGATSGDTVVSVINRGGLGAQTVEGIKIVDVVGASNGSFTLEGDYVFQGEQAVIAGAYGYRLYKNGVSDPDDGDWYLRSALLNPEDPVEEPLYQPGVPVYEGYTQTLLALNGLPTLQQRVGNRLWSEELVGVGAGTWGRFESQSLRPQPVSSTTGADRSIDSWQLQVGVDVIVSEREDGAASITGFSVHHGKADASITSVFGNGSIETVSNGVGASYTWYGRQGFYVDAQAKINLFESYLRSSALGSLVKGNDGVGEAVSVEVGKRFPVGDALALTPQFQAVYAHVDFDSYADPADATVSADKGSSLKTRWGLALSHQKRWNGASGDVRRTHVYGVANLTYEWLDGTRIEVSGTPVASRDQRAWAELGVGGSFVWGGGNNGRGGLYSLYAEVAADTPVSDFGDAHGFKGTVGFRANF